jgi:putative hydrolase of the HAD superfamily
MYRAVLFDWDDTLAAFRPHRYETVEGVLSEYGHVHPRGQLHRAWAVADDPTVAGRDPGFWQRFAREIELDDPAVLAALHEAFRQRDLIKRLALFEDVLELVERLAAEDLRLGVLSNNVEAARSAEALGLLPHLEIVVTPREAGAAKPDAAIFHHALALLGTAAEETLYVGDSYEHDVVGARAAGLPVVLVDRLGLSEEPDCQRFNSLAELRLQLPVR